MDIKGNYSLKKLNTFGIDVASESFYIVKSLNDLRNVLSDHKTKKITVLGGGSNILFSKFLDGLCLKIDLKGIDIIEENENNIIVNIMAGENWHDFVQWSVNNGFGGIENLSLIPGLVGAAPIQNIGAYGVELKDVFISCNTINIKDQTEKEFDEKGCLFGYRTSRFKTIDKNIYIITSVKVRLTKEKHKYNISYGSVKDEIGNREINLESISKAVIKIRKSKLPDTNLIGNCGSFFKNPVIDQSKYFELKKKFPSISAFKVEKNQYKLSAAWLIEFLKYKGKSIGNVGVYENQALVLVNLGGGTGKEILSLANKITSDVYSTFKIKLQPEVEIL
ncbi:MAG: UDP-N-acetylenolpyruvoylglucosamine reductase [Flavobacteriaceae bacterium TMED68]|nr:MAG: UDP-N-acetylenolpyruvoylglucosamine reductase [Flavobacteriaceae bacterium TMED68]